MNEKIKKAPQIVYERTIPEELLSQWKAAKRRKDGESISISLGFSRPVIDRALNFGYVKTGGLAEAITKFFADRLEDEKKQATQLGDLMADKIEA